MARCATKFLRIVEGKQLGNWMTLERLWGIGEERLIVAEVARCTPVDSRL